MGKHHLLLQWRVCQLSEDRLEVSFIIPTLNERLHIASTISTIRRNLSNISHEIIVVDNGSDDGTFEIAMQCADKVFRHETATIGGLRNIGAAESSGRILVFNDADVLISETWQTEFSQLRKSLLSEQVIVGGSLDAPPDDGLLFRGWFGPVLAEKSSGLVSYVGTGHMVLSRELFFNCGSFDETLLTGEDFDFCQRARKVGARVIFNHNLKTIHLGYPKSFKAFFKRELWHGKGDFQSFGTFFTSRVALFASAMLVAHFGLLLSLVSYNPIYTVFAIFSVLIFPVLFSIIKCNSKLGLKNRLANVWYSYSYLLARSLSWSCRSVA